MARDLSDEKTINDVAEYGWHDTHVHTDEEGPGFSFSVGFWETLAAPEVIIFGLRHELMHNMLWEVTEGREEPKRRRKMVEPH